jgi:NADPH:quinone reductase
MKAILIKQKGGPENLVLTEYPSPTPREGFVLVQIKAFGINHAEIYMRKGDWGDTTDIIGIECVGIVVEDPSGEYKKGQKMATMVGGMARSINGSYAEYINVPRANVIAFRSELPWNELAPSKLSSHDPGQALYSCRGRRDPCHIGNFAS